MSDVIIVAEGLDPRIGVPKTNEANAATYLVCRLFTDAVFNQDIRAIQLIINRIDGGLPKDTEVSNYKTEFGDCLTEVLNMTDGKGLTVKPDDTVMMALCKSLYDLSIQNIYWDARKCKKCKPSTEKKQERDAALRMILERTGGRKTLAEQPKEVETVEIAGWLSDLTNDVVE